MMLTPFDLLKTRESRHFCSVGDAIAAVVEAVGSIGSGAAVEGAADAGAAAAEGGAAAGSLGGAAAADAGAAATAGEAAGAAGSLGGASAAGAAGAIGDSIPEIVVNSAALPAAAQGGSIAATDLLGSVPGITEALSGVGGTGTAIPGQTGGTGATPSTSSAAAAKPVPGASGGSIGGSTSPGLANAAPGSDIGGPGSSNPFGIQSVGTPSGAYQTPGTDTLTFGSGNASNLTTQGGGVLNGITDAFGSGSSSAPLGIGGDSSVAADWSGAATTASKGVGGAIADSLGITNPIAKGAISALPAALPLAYTALKGDQAPKGTNALNSEAQQLSSQGQSMANYLATGTLPPGIQTALDSAKNSAIAAIKSSYASRGESGSSAEATDIANAEAQIVGQGSTIAMNLYQQGVSEQQVAAQIQGGLLTDTIAQDAQFSQALGTFASALAGGGNTLKLQVG